jgi:hypothetical protein
MVADKFTLNRQAVGLILIWMGAPLIFFIREKLGFGGSTLFTGLAYLFGCLLMFDLKPLSTFNRNNPILALLGYSFLGMAFLYFLIYNSEKNSFSADVINFGILFVLLLLLFRIDDEIQNYLPFYILIFSFVINLALVYSISTNPNYVLGARATVQYNSQASSEFSGNPHIYGRNGVIGIAISLLIMFKKQVGLIGSKSKLFNLLAHFNLLFSLIVLILTQTRGNLISLVFILFLFLFLKRNKINDELYSHRKIITSYYLIMGSSMVYFNQKYQIIDKIVMYYDQILYVVNRAVSTGVTMGKAGDNDPSAMGRVNSIDFVLKEFTYKPYNFILGNGFKYRYLDIPFLEVWLNFGLLGIFIYSLLNLYILYSITIAIRSNSIFQNFLALIYLNVFITLFTAGRPVDTIYWIFYLILIRFMNVKSVAPTLK